MLGWNLVMWGQQLACVISLSEPWWCLLAFLCCSPETIPWSHVARAFWSWDPGTFSHRLSLMNSSSHRLLVVIIVACVIILSPFIEPGLSLFLKLIYNLERWRECRLEAEAVSSNWRAPGLFPSGSFMLSSHWERDLLEFHCLKAHDREQNHFPKKGFP